MKLSYYLIKMPYTIAWNIANLTGKTKKIALYCEDSFDLILFKNVQKYLKPIPIIAKNKDVARKIADMGYKVSTMPQFPHVVIMFRNSAWVFPVKNIVKIGFEHGAYNFKRMSKAHYYNMFDVFCMTSSHDVERAKKRGVTTAIPVGFPKIDSIFDGSITEDVLESTRKKYNIDPNKRTLLFSSTWDGSGMSAIEKWYDRLDELSDRYNILATVHPWMSEQYLKKIKSYSNVHYLAEYEIFKEILISDVCIGDTNSLIAEFCLLDKPTITFKVPFTERTTKDVIELIRSASYAIDSFDELDDAVEKVLNNEKYQSGRQELIEKMVDNRDGLAGKRAAEIIARYAPDYLV